MKTDIQTKNIIGTTIRARRLALGWTQERLAAELRKAGFKTTRGGVAKVEARMVRIRDGSNPFFGSRHVQFESRQNFRKPSPDLPNSL